MYMYMFHCSSTPFPGPRVLGIKAMDDGHMKKKILVISPSYFVDSIYMTYSLC